MRWLHFWLGALEQLLVASLELPAEPGERHFWSKLARLQLMYSLAGLVLGFSCIMGGVVLFFHGVTGTSSWVGRFLGLESSLSDAAPGTVLFVVGLLVVWMTRFQIRVAANRMRPRKPRKAA